MPMRAIIVGPLCSATRIRGGFHGGQPLRGLMLGLRQFRDVVAGILQGDKLAPAFGCSLATVTIGHPRT